MTQIISLDGVSDDIAPVTGAAFAALAPGSTVDLHAYSADQVANGLLAGVLVSDGVSVTKRALGDGESWIEGYQGMYSRLGGDVYSWKWGKRRLLRRDDRGRVQLWKNGKKLRWCDGLTKG